LAICTAAGYLQIDVQISARKWLISHFVAHPDGWEYWGFDGPTHVHVFTCGNDRSAWARRVVEISHIPLAEVPDLADDLIPIQVVRGNRPALVVSGKTEALKRLQGFQLRTDLSFEVFPGDPRDHVIMVTRAWHFDAKA
jgi:hypothetical protein